MITRRTALFMFAAPAIVRATSLMSVRAYEEPLLLFYGYDLGNMDCTVIVAMNTRVSVPHIEIVEAGPEPTANDLLRLFNKYRYHDFSPRADRGSNPLGNQGELS